MVPQGLGTALKPAHEPICVARKPLVGTVAANVLQFGTGALNIDGCRVPGAKHTQSTSHPGGQNGKYSPIGARGPQIDDGSGRWPANLIHDGIELEWARFFYCPKASKSDRGEGNTHATVKPIELMRYLVRLVTPPDGLVLDPFAGSGTTLIAARREGFSALGIEFHAEHVEIIKRRIENELSQPSQVSML